MIKIIFFIIKIIFLESYANFLFCTCFFFVKYYRFTSCTKIYLLYSSRNNCIIIFAMNYLQMKERKREKATSKALRTNFFFKNKFSL